MSETTMPENFYRTANVKPVSQCDCKHEGCCSQTEFVEWANDALRLLQRIQDMVDSPRATEIMVHLESAIRKSTEKK